MSSFEGEPAGAFSGRGFSLEEAVIRNDWTRREVAALFDLPFAELMYRAQGVHRMQHDPNRVQLSNLLSIKTGGCPEDCAYCPQSLHHDARMAAAKLMRLETVVAAAEAAKAAGAQRFCMGAAWRSPNDRDLDAVCDMVTAVKATGMETCVTLGMLKPAQAERLKRAGLDYYNHNLDTSPEYYPGIISTRTYADRLDTLANVRQAGISVCCGGIVGMGECRDDRVGLIHALATLPEHPESVPINLLVRVEGTPAWGSAELDPIELVRTLAVGRITMPRSVLRLSAGRESMSDELQALCLLAGAGSIFCGPRLLTTPNPSADRDGALLARLGIKPLSG